MTAIHKSYNNVTMQDVKIKSRTKQQQQQQQQTNKKEGGEEETELRNKYRYKKKKAGLTLFRGQYNVPWCRVICFCSVALAVTSEGLDTP